MWASDRTTHRASDGARGGATGLNPTPMIGQMVLFERRSEDFRVRKSSHRKICATPATSAPRFISAISARCVCAVPREIPLFASDGPPGSRNETIIGITSRRDRVERACPKRHGSASEAMVSPLTHGVVVHSRLATKKSTLHTVYGTERIGVGLVRLLKVRV